MNAHKKKLIHWLGLLGIVSLASYAAAVLFAPLAYPGYDWKSQAVSDLSAASAPSLPLWNQLSSLYGLCGIVCIMAVCLAVQGRLSKLLRAGLYIFAAMNWVSGVGYVMFPLSESGFAGGFQDIIHVYVVTAFVVILSIVSLALIIAGGLRKKQFVSLAIWAAVALALMFIGAIGVNAAPKEYFGVFERLSVFAATGFNAVLGIFLFRGRLEPKF
ncbi:MAG: DUF998 domain-containing protein [Oscillospiraceae bacterium]|jgi:hypothetical membrane protein|nr:DUF998 domain-containing protein [Oscillospiraceae bacterium]